LEHIVYQAIINQRLDSVWDFHAALYLISARLRKISGTKKPTRFSPCGFSGLHRVGLVTIDQEFGGLAESEFYPQLYVFK
jgi:hypothetical protein